MGMETIRTLRGAAPAPPEESEPEIMSEQICVNCEHPLNGPHYKWDCEEDHRLARLANPVADPAETRDSSEIAKSDLRELWARLYVHAIFTNDPDGSPYKRYVTLPTEGFDQFDHDFKAVVLAERERIRQQAYAEAIEAAANACYPKEICQVGCHAADAMAIRALSTPAIPQEREVTMKLSEIIANALIAQNMLRVPILNAIAVIQRSIEERERLTGEKLLELALKHHVDTGMTAAFDAGAFSWDAIARDLANGHS
jgi:hypothetical protein